MEESIKNCQTCGHNVKGDCMLSGFSISVARALYISKIPLCNENFHRWVPKQDKPVVKKWWQRIK